MKRDAFNHHKFKKLARALKLPVWAVEGLMARIWNFTARRCPSGDIGRFSPEDLAIDIDYDDDPEVLLEILHDISLVDKRTDGIFIIHDWSDHCEDTTHRTVARRREFFANGNPPDLAKLLKSEREKVSEYYSVPNVPHKVEHVPTCGNVWERVGTCAPSHDHVPVLDHDHLPEPFTTTTVPETNGGGLVNERAYASIPGTDERKVLETAALFLNRWGDKAVFGFTGGTLDSTARQDLLDLFSAHLQNGVVLTPELANEVTQRTNAAYDNAKKNGTVRGGRSVRWWINQFGDYMRDRESPNGLEQKHGVRGSQVPRNGKSKYPAALSPEASARWEAERASDLAASIAMKAAMAREEEEQRNAETHPGTP